MGRTYSPCSHLAATILPPIFAACHLQLLAEAALHVLALLARLQRCVRHTTQAAAIVSCKHMLLIGQWPALQVAAILPMLKRGIGIHHSGLLPILKEVIEIMFQEGLLKVGRQSAWFGNLGALHATHQQSHWVASCALKMLCASSIGQTAAAEQQVRASRPPAGKREQTCCCCVCSAYLPLRPSPLDSTCQPRRSYSPMHASLMAAASGELLERLQGQAGCAGERILMSMSCSLPRHETYALLLVLALN